MKHGTEIVYALKKRSLSLISLVFLWNPALIVRNGHRNDSPLSLICPGIAESRRNGCLFGCDMVVGDWTVIDKGKEGDWLRINGGGHCWDTCVKDDRFGE
jgi:hypothetical protein